MLKLGLNSSVSCPACPAGMPVEMLKGERFEEKV